MCFPNLFLRWFIFWFLKVCYTSFCLLYSLIIQAYSRIFAFRCIEIFEEFEKWKNALETFAFELHIVVLFSVFWIKSQKLQKISLSFLLLSCNFISSYLQKEKKLDWSSCNLFWNSFYTPFYFSYRVYNTIVIHATYPLTKNNS